MPNFSAVAQFTGVDLSDVEGFRVRVAGDIIAGLPGKFDLGQAQAAVQEALRRVMSSAPVKVLAQVSIAAEALAEVQAALAADVRTTEVVNVGRLSSRRDDLVNRVYKLGDWWSTTKVKGPAKPRLTKKYNESLEDFLGQWSPPEVMASLARGTGKRDAGWPTWPASLADPNERAFAFAGELALDRVMGTLPVVSPPWELGQCSSYSTCGTEFLDALDLEIRSGLLRWAAKRVCLPQTLLDGCSVPPSAWLHVCLGAAPFLGWLGQPLPLGPTGLAIVAGLRSPSAIHCAVPRSKVEASLRAIVLRTGVLELPEDPGQTASGVFRRGVRIVFRGTLPGVNGPPWRDTWSPATGFGPTQRPAVPGAALASIIDAHLDWLALREAIVRTVRDLPGPVREAAATLGDAELKKAAAGTLGRRGRYVLDDPTRLAPKPAAPPAAEPEPDPEPEPEPDRGWKKSGTLGSVPVVSEIHPGVLAVGAGAALGAIVLGLRRRR